MSSKPTSGKKRDSYGMTAEDWRRLDEMTDEEITAAALADPDNPPLTEEQLAQFRRPSLAMKVRRALRMSREAFAAAYGIPLETLQAWERHQAEPTESISSSPRIRWLAATVCFVVLPHELQ